MEALHLGVEAWECPVDRSADCSRTSRSPKAHVNYWNMACAYPYIRTHSLGLLSETSQALVSDSKPAYEFVACQST